MPKLNTPNLHYFDCSASGVNLFQAVTHIPSVTTLNCSKIQHQRVESLFDSIVSSAPVLPCSDSASPMLPCLQTFINRLSWCYDLDVQKLVKFAVAVRTLKKLVICPTHVSTVQQAMNEASELGDRTIKVTSIIEPWRLDY